MTALRFSCISLFACILPAGCALKTSGHLGSTDGGDAIPQNCGNGVVDDDEECDDGRNGDPDDGCRDDCTWSCHGDDECAGGGDSCAGTPACDIGTHTCEAGDPRPDGFVCGDDPRSICLDGACRESVCGDGFVDAGGGEFCEPPEAGCIDDCTYGCENDDDCPNDHDPCNGEEHCGEAGTCARRSPLEGGAVCGEDPRSICVSGSCRESICGDGFVDEGMDPPEECDDGRDGDPDDGCRNDCTYSCHGDGDCDDGSVCNGLETCADPTEAGRFCEEGDIAAEGTACDDGRSCTLVDACDNSGACVGSGDPCADDLDCTENELCSEGSDGPVCSHDIVSGSCLIAGICYGEGERNPDNECEECRPSDGNETWSAVEDGTVCISSGTIPSLCCGGACRAGAECCTDADCETGCAGEALPCLAFWEEAACNSQIGCAWTTLSSAYCGETPDACSDLEDYSLAQCNICGCDSRIWNHEEEKYVCAGGPPGLCYVHSDSETQCASCGCSWIDSGNDGCGGDHPACSTFSAAQCGGQAGCSWHEGICDLDSYTCR